MDTNSHLFMVSFDGVPDHWMDGGFVPLETLFLAAKDERGARLIAVANDRHLDVDSDMKIVDLGLTDNRLGFCTDKWDILTPEQYELIFEADGISFEETDGKSESEAS